MRLPGAFSAVLHGKNRIAIFAFSAVVGLALIGWVAARQIRSPAQVAADTAPPKPAAITVPVIRRLLSTEVIVRGTVRYGDPQAVVLGSSTLKSGDSDIVTRPPHRGLALRPGHAVMTVDGRPVFVLPGRIPMHRDLHPGDHGPDVRQLERALARLGYHPGAVDGRYDSATAGAVSAFYLSRGWDPFGATDAQLEQLRTARANAAAAKDAELQAVSALQQAQQGSPPGDVAQARIDAVTARDTLNTATSSVTSARHALASARAAAHEAAGAATRAAADARRDNAAAAADVSAKQSAVNAAFDDTALARTKFTEVPFDAPASERVAAGNALREAADNLSHAQSDLHASKAAATSARAAGQAAVQKARDDTRAAQRDASGAAADLRRARRSVGTARRQVRLTAQKVRVMTLPASDTHTLAAIVGSDRQEAQRTQAIVDRIARQSGVQVPANELVYFPSFPVRVDTVKAKRGTAVTGAVMKVTNSRLAVDSSLEVSDAKLVRPGDTVTIEEQDLGIRAPGVVSQVARTPGTNRVDPSRFYFAVTPKVGFPQLVGTSVKLTIAVKSTRGHVLAVPPSALSIGGNGDSRVQVQSRGRILTVPVLPGLAAQGLVEVRPTGHQALAPGDLVVVGARGGVLGARTGP